eukprot:NODE_9239_length_1437_cov_8.266412.p1 GENE.NODE_9239_length_1437_cov_8.266412~~NODE_9239_length_1437_cov_8.266412.p1  ORF type:complete len:439 (-),score=103.86 NODE_9239_length_1437_cov_8.266412:119-1360(-)
MSHSRGGGFGAPRHKEQPKPYYDPKSPCGHFFAGYCWHGEHCAMSHNVDYVQAIRAQWLQPDDIGAREHLEVAAKAAERPFDSKTFARRVNASLRHAREAPTRCVPDVLVVLDLEGKPQNGGVIEFPVLLLNTRNKCEIGRFQRFVCLVTRRDGAQPSVPLGAPTVPFPQVLSEFSEWMRGYGLDLDRPSSAFAFVTCGDWDLKRAIPSEYELVGGAATCGRLPAAFGMWINMKDIFNAHYGTHITGMKGAMGRYGLLDAEGEPKHGFHHVGMHDVENIARVMVKLLNEDAAIDLTWPAHASLLRLPPRPGASDAPATKSAEPEPAGPVAAPHVPGRLFARPSFRPATAPGAGADTSVGVCAGTGSGGTNGRDGGNGGRADGGCGDGSGTGSGTGNDGDAVAPPCRAQGVGKG